MNPRIEELSKLRDGWLDGEGKAPSKEYLEWLDQALDTYLSKDVPYPYLYPMQEGGIEAEWDIGDFSVSLAVNGTDGYLHSLNLKTHTPLFKPLDLTWLDSWEFLNLYLKKCKES